jgi:hypothetical protein
MFGRALFALVWLIIAAGVLLPIYPSETERPSFVAADRAVLTTDLTAAECRDCRVARDDRADCRFECPCDRVLPVTFVPVEEAFRLSVVLLIRPLPSGRSAKILLLPSKLPAI